MIEYTPTTWVNRKVENPLTYTMTENDDGTVTLTPAPGTITAEGTKVSAENLNNIEAGIEACVEGINTNYSSIQELGGNLAVTTITDDETYIYSVTNTNTYFQDITTTGFYYLANNQMFMLVLNYNDEIIYQYIFNGTAIYINTYKDGSWNDICASIEGSAG